MTAGRQLFELSEGAWDATVDPLVHLWGFGPKQRSEGIPGQPQIAEALESVGFAQIKIGDRRLEKTRPDVTLDLGSIAKGYGVDQVAALLQNRGFKHFLVEIGGEVYAEGSRKDGAPWRVGINRPLKDAPRDAVYRVVALSGRAMATSGDYRNFIEINGKRYSHVIDPRTGYPVANGVVSATVLADKCTFADGLATALMVMGAEKGIPLVNGLSEVECLLIVVQPDGTLAEFQSDGFGAFAETI
jgi:thiamine biosynthesis lipoprotein